MARDVDSVHPAVMATASAFFKRLPVRITLLLPLVFLAVFFFFPLLSIFALSLAPGGNLDLGGFRALIESDYYIRTIVFTAGQAVLSTVLTLVLALPAAFVFTRYQFRGKSVLLSLATLPFVLPTIVVAAAFSALIGERGIANQWLSSLLNLESAPIQLERTLAIILIVHVFYNFSIALRMIVGYWSTQSARIEEAARVLGASGWRLWLHVRLPLLRPVLFAAGLLVFVFTFTSFGVILILGGPRFATLEVEIYFQATSLFQLPTAAALSLIQILIMFAVMTAYTRLQARQARGELTAAHNIARVIQTKRERLLVTLIIAGMAILLFAPLFALVVRSLTVGGEGITFRYFELLATNPRGSVLFVPPLVSIFNSVVIAAATTGLAVVLGCMSAYLLARSQKFVYRWLDVVFMLPLATSAVTLGFGFVIALDEPPLNLRTSALLLPIAHTLVAMPFVVRSVLPALRAISPGVREAAQVLGASPLNTWLRVELPLIARGLVVGATFAFTVSMGEFGASAFIARPDTPTMPVVIYRLLGQPGIANYGQALAMSTVLLLVCAVSFLVIERTRTLGIGEF